MLKIPVRIKNHQKLQVDRQTQTETVSEKERRERG